MLASSSLAPPSDSGTTWCKSTACRLHVAQSGCLRRYWRRNFCHVTSYPRVVDPSRGNARAGCWAGAWCFGARCGMGILCVAQAAKVDSGRLESPVAALRCSLASVSYRIVSLGRIVHRSKSDNSFVPFIRFFLSFRCFSNLPRIEPGSTGAQRRGSQAALSCEQATGHDYDVLLRSSRFDSRSNSISTFESSTSPASRTIKSCRMTRFVFKSPCLRNVSYDISTRAETDVTNTDAAATEDFIQIDSRTA